jgi:lysophospholipase L1-like esterase
VAGISLLLCVLLSLSPAGASAAHQTYLALGDSLAFGYTQGTFNSLNREGDPAAENPVDFDRGYVDDLGRLLEPYRPGIEIVNDGCPGETTDSFIEGPCSYGLTYRLHHPYVGGSRSSQLSDALHYLRTHRGRVGPVTLDIGANDALKVIYTDCERAPTCINARAPALFAHIASNLAVILRRLRAAYPRGRILVLGVYDPFGTSIAGIGGFFSDLNATEAAQARIVGARFADPLPAFNPELLEAPTLCRLVGVCDEGDIHPTYAGYEVLAELLLAQYRSFQP